ncbi:related to DNA-directed RNA polymerase A (I) chain [Lecanosticta acicola]|uniref:Related to DNA-directed RNA polymerase A (I) chain n=1 Tax=Lecanosticta acicola TaxID=111012 RepID=A0AAI9EE14_9PEZI|nr:related to DNA-directed RNA polymerase A (I) chain [Lecanosticta acicola]
MAEKEKENKKRKRASNGVETPSKKVAFDGASGGDGKVAVSHVEEKYCPVVLSAKGVNAPRVPFRGYAQAKALKDTDGSVQPKTHNLLLQSSQHPRLDYTATPSTLDQNLSHYFAVFDPVTKRLQVTPAHHLELKTTLRSETLEVEKDKLTNAQQREQLGREFGTKKAKKAIASKTENAITQDTKGKGKVTDVQTAVLEAVEDATAGAASRNVAEGADAAFAAKPIPKPNLQAESVEGVYPYRTLIPPGDDRLVNIKDWQDMARADEAINFSHRFPAYRVSRLGKSDETMKLKALRYLTLLLEFHDALSNARSGRKVPKSDILKRKLAAWPSQLVDNVRRRFANESGQELGKWHMENLYTHMCALSLYVDGWVTATTDLKEDLKMEQREISKYFLELGCKVSAPTEADKHSKNITKAQASVTKMAKLKLPLEFPKPRAGRRR